jgi:hypothetical protein
MSALKSPDQQFLNAYLDVLCDREGASGTVGATAASSSHRRSVLVDVASAPQGLQIVTLVRRAASSTPAACSPHPQLLTSVSNEQRERIIRTVRKNSVFLKGSKAGLKVHQLCGEQPLLSCSAHALTPPCRARACSRLHRLLIRRLVTHTPCYTYSPAHT